jgi:hypothetical protein
MWVLVGTRFSSDNNIMATRSRMRLLVLVGWPFVRFFHVAQLHCYMPVVRKPKWLILLLLRAGTGQSRCPSLVLPALVLCWVVHDRVPGAIAPHL